MRAQAYVLTQVGPPLPKQRSTIHSGSPPLNVSGEGSGNMYTNNSLGSATAAARSKFAILPASVPPTIRNVNANPPRLRTHAHALCARVWRGVRVAELQQSLDYD